MNTITKVQNYVADLFEKEDVSKLFFHSYAHTLEVVATTLKMAQVEALSPSNSEVLILAAWFHDLGYLYTYHEHEAKSIAIAIEYLESIAYPKDKLNRLVGCIAATKLSQAPKTPLEALLKDADLAYGVNSNFFERGRLLRLEWNKQLGKTYSELEWEELQLNFLSNLTFHSHYAQLHFEPVVANNLVKQKEIFAKLKKV